MNQWKRNENNKLGNQGIGKQNLQQNNTQFKRNMER